MLVGGLSSPNRPLGRAAHRINAILVSHFLIDLQEANRKPTMAASGDALHLSADSGSDTGAAASSLRFSCTVDSLGAMISGPGGLGPDAESYDEDLDKEEEGVGEDMGAESLRLNRGACLGSVDAEAGPRSGCVVDA